ncbi:MAG: hypothetical protein ACI4IE_06850 [Eubacterium sp.]
MLDNITSSRIDYKSFIYDEPFTESPYFLYLKEPVDKKSILILPKGKADIDNINALIKKLRKKKFNIYALDTAKKLIEYDGVIYVKKGSNEYKKAFAVCKYIYALDMLYSGFVKRDGQIVICALKNVDNPANLTQRIGFTSLISKTDYFVYQQKYNCIEFKKLLKAIARGKLEPAQPRSDGKKNILFEVNCANADTCLSTFERISNVIDLSKYNVSALIPSKYCKMYAQMFTALNSKINIFIKRGKIFADKETDKKAKFLTKEIFYLKDYNQVFDFFPDYVFDYERRKLFGDIKFDTVINMGHNAFYWTYLAKSLCKNVHYLDVNDYSNADKENLSGKARLAGFYDRVYYLSKYNFEKACSYNPALKNKAQIAEYIPTKNRGVHNDAEAVEINGKKRLVAKTEKIEGFDSINVTTVEYFEKGVYSYVITDPMKSLQDNLSLIDYACKHTDKLMVFDLSMCIPDSFAVCSNAVYFDSYEIYMSLISRLDKCFAFSDSDGIITEAKAFLKDVIIFE